MHKYKLKKIVLTSNEPKKVNFDDFVWFGATIDGSLALGSRPGTDGDGAIVVGSGIGNFDGCAWSVAVIDGSRAHDSLSGTYRHGAIAVGSGIGNFDGCAWSDATIDGSF